VILISLFYKENYNLIVIIQYFKNIVIYSYDISYFYVIIIFTNVK